MRSPYVPIKGSQRGHTRCGSDRGAAVSDGDAVDAPLPHSREHKKIPGVGALQVQVVRPASAAADCEIRVWSVVRQASSKISPSIAIAIPAKSGR